MQRFRPMARDVRNLEVFRESDRLLLDVVAVTATLSGPGGFILRNQLTRAALSVPLNLVEGSQRSTTREYGRFVEIAAGSAAEARYLLSVAGRLAQSDQRLLQLEHGYDALVRRLQTLRSRLADLAGKTDQPCRRSMALPMPPSPSECSLSLGLGPWAVRLTHLLPSAPPSHPLRACTCAVVALARGCRRHALPGSCPNVTSSRIS